MSGTTSASSCMFTKNLHDDREKSRISCNICTRVSSRYESPFVYEIIGNIAIIPVWHLRGERD